MSLQPNEISDLRRKIAQKAEILLKSHLSGLISLDSFLNELSPEQFNNVRRYNSREEKQIIKKTHTSISLNSDEYSVTMSIMQAINDNHWLVFLGDPGLGKTTCLLYLTLKYATNVDAPIPVYIELNDYRHRNGLSRMINSFIGLQGKHFKDLSYILFLDGINEISKSEQKELLIDLNTLQNDFTKPINVVITSRKTAVPPIINDWPTFEFMKFNKIQVRNYLNIVFDEYETKAIWDQINTEHLFDIASIPLYLRFICYLKKTNHALPSTKGGILNEIVSSVYLSEESFDKVMAQIPPYLQTITKEECLSLLSQLAYSVYEITGSISFDKSLIDKIFKQNMQNKIWDIVNLFEQLRLIEKHEIKDQEHVTNTFYRFGHQSLFEYFAGLYLKSVLTTQRKSNKAKLQQVIHPYIECIKWDEPIKIAFELCDEEFANRLFAIILDIDDLFLSLKYVSSLNNRLHNKLKVRLENKCDTTFNKLHASGINALIFALSTSGYPPLFDYLDKKLISNNNLLTYSICKYFVISGGPEAVSCLINQLSNKKHDTRMFAAEALGEIGDPIAVPHLINLFNKQNELNREVIIEALGKIGDIHAVTFLFQQLENARLDISFLASIEFFLKHEIFLTISGNIHTSFMVALSKLTNRNTINYLNIKLNDNNSHVRHLAALVLGNSGISEAIPHLMKMLDEKGDIHKTAAITLGNMGNSHSYQHLIHMLDDKNSIVCIMSILTLGNLGDPHAVPYIIKKFDKINRNISEFSVQALGNLGGEKATQFIENIVMYENDPGYFYNAIQALAKIGHSHSFQPLINCLKRSNRKEKIVRLITKTDAAHIIPTLIEIIDNSYLKNYRIAIEALKDIDNIFVQDKIKDIPPITELYTNKDKYNSWFHNKTSDNSQHPSETPPLIQKYGKTHLNNIRKALDALNNIEYFEMTPISLKILENNFSTTILYTTTLLSIWGDQRAVKPLINLIKDERDDIVLHAVETLGKIGDPQAVKYLIEILQGKRKYFKHSTVTALGRIGDKRAVKPLIKMLGNGDRMLNHKIIEALGNIGDPQAIPDMLKQVTDDLFHVSSIALSKIYTKSIETKRHETYFKIIKTLKNRSQKDEVAFNTLNEIIQVTSRRFLDIDNEINKRKVMKSKSTNKPKKRQSVTSSVKELIEEVKCISEKLSSSKIEPAFLIEDERVLQYFKTDYKIYFEKEKPGKGFITINGKEIRLTKIQPEVVNLLIMRLKSEWGKIKKNTHPRDIGWVDIKELSNINGFETTDTGARKVISGINIKIRKLLGINRENDLIENGNKKYDKERKYRLRVHPKLIKK